MPALRATPQLSPLEPRRLLSAGDVDLSFGSDGRIDVGASVPAGPPALLAAPGGEILLIARSGGDVIIQRRDADGSLDDSFGTGGIATSPLSQLADAEVMSDGRLVLADYRGRFARLNADGSLDTSFGNGGIADVTPVFGVDAFTYEIEVQSTGDIVAMGGHGYLYRLAADGSFDAAFDRFDYTKAVGVGDWGTIDLLADDRIVLGGRNLVYGEQPFDFVRLEADGALDTTFADGGYFNGLDAASFAVRADGSILAAWFTDERRTLRAQRIDSSGELDATVNVSIASGYLAGEPRFLFQDDGRTIIYTELTVTRVNTDGSLDQSFGRLLTHYWEGALRIRGATLDAAGDILIATARSALGATGELHRLQGDAAAPDAGPFAVAGQTLAITGTAGDDGYFIDAVDTAVYAQTRYGFGRVYDASDVSNIQASLLGGNDKLIVYAGTRPATLDGGDGNDTLRGGNGSDSIAGGEGEDVLVGHDGNDTLHGEGGRDVIIGGFGDDSIRGGSSADKILGQGGNDLIWGDGGRDMLSGGEGADVLRGNGGPDTLISHLDGSVDQLFGDGGTDLALADDDDLLNSIELS